MDHFGALIGPLTVAGVLALTGNDLVPVLYAGAMVVDTVAALATGWMYDRTVGWQRDQPPAARVFAASRFPGALGADRPADC
jgi:hypothetical protein